MLISELFVFDLMLRCIYAAQCSLVNPEAVFLFQESKIASFLQEQAHDREAEELFFKTNELRSCLKDKGFFMFKES